MLVSPLFLRAYHQAHIQVLHDKAKLIELLISYFLAGLAKLRTDNTNDFVADFNRRYRDSPFTR